MIGMAQVFWLTIQSRPDRFPSFIYQNTGVVIKLHNAAIRSLVFLRRPHNNCVPDVSSSDLVRGRDRHTTVRPGLWAKISLLLNNDNYSIA